MQIFGIDAQTSSCQLLGRLEEYTINKGGAKSLNSDAQSNCPAKTDRKKILQRFADSINGITLSNSKIIEYNNSKVLIQLSDLKEEELLEFLIFAFIGKHFAQTSNHAQQTILQFDVNTGTITFPTSSCEYQQPLYRLLLIVTILLLVYILLIQDWKNRSKEKP